MLSYLVSDSNTQYCLLPGLFLIETEISESLSSYFAFVGVHPANGQSRIH